MYNKIYAIKITVQTHCGEPRIWKSWEQMGSRAQVEKSALKGVGASSGMDESTEVFTAEKAECGGILYLTAFFPYQTDIRSSQVFIGWR